VRTDGVRSGLEAIYTLASDAIEARGPACWASGNCCNFDSAGHRLYVTGLEAAYTVDRLGDVATAPALTPLTLDGAIARGGCPFQLANLCGVHTIKPVGCRVYFCDRGAQQWQQDLSERLLAMVRELHARHDIEYRYGEWRAMLARFVA
jgi:Fe-S-cluster containining protein